MDTEAKAVSPGGPGIRIHIIDIVQPPGIGISPISGSPLGVLVVAAPPGARLVASPGGAVEPLVHPPQAVHSARIGGEVTVTATLDGDTISGSGEIIVQSRDWSTDTVRYQVIEKPQQDRLPAQPTRVGNLGGTANHGGIYALPGEREQITSGPQSGVWYWLHTPAQGESWVYIHRIALQAGSDFYLLQPTTATALDSCTQADVVPFLPLVEAHEGLHLEPDSHTEAYRWKLNELVPQATEPVVSMGIPGYFDAKTTSETTGEFLTAFLYARDSSNGGTVPPAPYCYFRFF